MKRGWRIRSAVVLCGLVAVLAGCSVGGARGPLAEGLRFAPAQVAAALSIQQWAQTLWGLVASQTGTETPSFGIPVVNPDGSVTQAFSAADGTEAVLTAFTDGSVRLEVTYPDGTTQTARQSEPSFDGVSRVSIAWVIESSDGLSVSYTSVSDNAGTPSDVADDATDLEGRAELPGGLSQQFGVATANGQTTVHSLQSDGAEFDFVVPLAGPDFQYPDFSQPATGTYTGSGSRAEFVLPPTPTAVGPARWAVMSSDLGDGLAGEFVLAPDFSGSGRVSEGGAPLAMLSWTPRGETQLAFLTAERSDISPSGASLDWLTHRWQTLTALLAPAPGAGRSP